MSAVTPLDEDETSAKRADLARYFADAGYPLDGRISIGTKAGHGDDARQYWTSVLVRDAPRQILASAHANVWHGACLIEQPGPGARGGRKHVTAVPALWFDGDIGPRYQRDEEHVWALIDAVSERIGARPVHVTYTGHGMQPRWALEGAGFQITDEDERERVTRIVKAFGELVEAEAQKLGGHVDSTSDISRVLRSPHTTNRKAHKDGTPREPVSTWVKFPDHPWELVSLSRLLDVVEEYMAPPRPKPVPSTGAREPLAPNQEAWIRAAVTGELARLDEMRKAATPNPDDYEGKPWNTTTYEVACNLIELANLGGYYTLQAAHDDLLKHSPRDKGFTAGTVEGRWASAFGKIGEGTGGHVLPEPKWPASGADGAQDQPASWRKYPWNERGIADRTVALYGRVLRSDGEDSWFVYRDGAWRSDRLGGRHHAQAMMRRLPDLEAGLYSDEERKGLRGGTTSDREDFLRWRNSNDTSARARGAAAMIANDKSLATTPADFDANPMLLNTADCVIDLVTGERLPQAPELMLRHQSPVHYDPDAKAPLWEAFLQRVQPDEAQRKYLQRLVGYSLTGSITEQVMFIHLGPGSSGKSTALVVLGAMLGDYAQAVPPTTLLAKRGDTAIPNDVARMAGARLLSATETAAGKYFDDEAVKRLTGGEKVSARFMRAEWFDFTPTGKIHLATNHPPLLDSGGSGIARRLRYIGWDVAIPEEQRDRTLPARIIAAELPGVLAWAVRGCLEWQRNGLTTPTSVREHTAERIADADPLAQFLDERVIRSNGETEWTETYDAYLAWAGKHGVKSPMSGKAFSSAMQERGFTKWKHSRTRRQMFSLQLRLVGASTLLPRVVDQ